MPEISVIIPTYNHERFVTEAVHSVLDQGIDALEVIAIDDASADRTWDRLCAIDDPRLVRVRHERNLGAHATLNEGIERARAPVVAILNSDDVYRPGRLRQALATLQCSPDLAAVFSAYELIDERSSCVGSEAAVEGRTLPPSADDLPGDLSPGERRTLPLVASNFLHTTSNLVCRTSVVRSLGGFRDYRYVHDHDFFLRLSSAHAWTRLPQALLAYRRHGHNTLNENALASVAETMAMLMRFFVSGSLPSLSRCDVAAHSVLSYLASNLQLYGGERWALLMSVAALSASDPSAIARRLSEISSWTDVADQAIRSVFQRDHALQDLPWQREQTEYWWREALANAAQRDRLQGEVTTLSGQIEQFARDLAWQKTQTDLWWSARNEMALRYERAHLLGLPFFIGRIRARLSKTRKSN